DDTVRLAQRNHRLRHNYTTTKRVNEDLLKQLQSALSGNSNETQELLKQLQSYQNDLQAREDALSSAESALLSKRTELEKATKELQRAQREIALRNARILEMEEMLAQKDKLMRDLRDRVMSALEGYQGNGLNVHMKDGLLYVSLDEQLLFKSGSWTVDPRGQAAIKDLGKVLADNKDIQITIEGHTDNVPYNGSGALKDNWDLSAKRATSIVKILLQGSHISPERITAAGRGEFVPLDKANTAAARQKNRRTEIILMPNMNDLMNALNGL
ncbi:MAG: OmpA family protein, partial [Bacteroidales bacterium]|nr:OmpA family protein [Bacteroidales bacterium]